MSDSKHTPGPLLSHNDIDGSEIIYVDRPEGGTTTVARVYTGEHHGRYSDAEVWPSWDEGMATSALFKAAPDLLEACRAWLAFHAEATCACPDLRERMRLRRLASSQATAAIAKATD